MEQTFLFLFVVKKRIGFDPAEPLTYGRGIVPARSGVVAIHTSEIRDPPMPSFSLRNFVCPASLACFLLTAILGLGADLYSKQLAFEKLAPHGVEWTPDGKVHVAQQDTDLIVYRFIPLWIHFQATANQGAVFGIGQGQRPLFLAVSVAAIAFISFLFATSGRRRFYQFILGLLLAGVLGNMYDRLSLGFVRDMIWILPSRKIWGTQREIFPWIFNVADSLLCVGVFLIFVYSLRPIPKTADETEPHRMGSAEGHSAV
jgi:signal peptidase II